MTDRHESLRAVRHAIAYCWAQDPLKEEECLEFVLDKFDWLEDTRELREYIKAQLIATDAEYVFMTHRIQVPPTAVCPRRQRSEDNWCIHKEHGVPCDPADRR